MTVFWRMAVTLALVAFATVVKPGCAYACSCLPPGPPQEALANASTVFSGRVTAIDVPSDRGGPEPVQVTFTVAQGWKGANQTTLVVNTPASSASCGVDFVEGEEYLVYASTNEGRLQTSLCSRTAQLGMASEDLAVLGTGSTPTAATNGMEQPTTLPDTGGATTTLVRSSAVAISGVLLIVVGLIVRRQCLRAVTWRRPEAS